MGGGQAKPNTVVQAQPQPPQPAPNAKPGVPQQQAPAAGGPTPKQTPVVGGQVTPQQVLPGAGGQNQKFPPSQQPKLPTNPNATFQEEGEAEMDDELALATMQGNTFQGSSQNKNVMQSLQGAIVNRFKDSVEANSAQKPQLEKKTTQVEQVNQTINSYQQQMKEMKTNIDRMGQTLGVSIQEGEEEEGYGTLGGDQITTFRTEMMTKGADSIRPNHFVEKQPTPAGPQSDPRQSIQTGGGKDSQRGGGGLAGAMNMNQTPSAMDQRSYGGGGPQKLFESQRTPLGETFVPQTNKYDQSSYPNFHQESRATFNVDFVKDKKHATQSLGGYEQQPSSQYQQQQESSYRAQPSMHPPSSNNMVNNFRQDTKYSDGIRMQETFHQGAPDYGSAHQSNAIPQNTLQQIMGETNRTQGGQQHQQMSSEYAMPSRKEPSMPSYVPIPKDQLLSQDQKELLRVGQPANEKVRRALEQPLTVKQMIQSGAHLKQDEDELGLSGYYNFDSGAKPEIFAINRTKVVPVPSKGADIQPVPRQEKPITPSVQQDKSSKQEPPSKSETQARTPSAPPQTQNNQQPSIDELAYLKEQFMEQEERERLNPQNMLVRVLFIHAFDSKLDPEQAALEESRTERRLYSFFINKAAKVQDLKSERFVKEFGFDLAQLKLFFRYKELNNQQLLMDIETFDIEEDILTCITINAPKTYIPAILRDPLDDIKMADVRLLNSRTDAAGNASQAGKNDVSTNFDIERFDVDNDKLHWPAYRDWTAEAAFLSEIIVRNKSVLLSDEQQFLMQQGITRHLHDSPELAELAEAEAAFRKLTEEFRRASLYAVHCIIKKNPTPLNLFNLYGDDGDKFVVGGILIRRAKDWTICGQAFTESAKLHTTAIGPNGDQGNTNLLEIMGKIASLDVRNLAIMRNRLPRLVVPLGSLVDYFGIKFECQSLAPISINSVVYGSDTNGLTFTNRDAHAEAMAKQISLMLNLKPHYIEEQATGKLKQAYLPYTVQLHRNKDLQGDLNLYLLNPFRLFPQDESLRQPSSNPVAQVVVPFQEIMSKQLRPELCLQNNKGEPDLDCQYFTWKRPTKCDECGEFINDHEYYYYEKKSVDKTQRVLVQYYCCINCYFERLPTESFKYPVNKIQKRELQPKDRLQFYQNMKTGHRYLSMQFARVPLNPDAYFHLSNGKDKADKISEQEEILRAAQKLKDEVMGKLIDEFNSVDVDPLNGEQLTRIMHNRGINIRYIGRLCTQAELNHIRELCVIEVIARSAKLLIKDGLTFLADDEEAGFMTENIKKCVLHYLLEIFNHSADQSPVASSGSAQNIWDFITEHARKKFQVTIEKDILGRISMSGLLVSLCSKLNIKLKRSARDIDFYSVNPSTGERDWLRMEDIDYISPIVKDYNEDQPVLGGGCKEEVYPTSLSIVLESARMKDAQGKRSQWYMRGGEEREEATELYRLSASFCEQIYTSQSLRYARILKEFAEHLESRHQEKGRPENSRWNKSFAIPEDDLSSEARFFYNTSLQTFTDIGQDFTVEAAQIFLGLSRLVKPRNAQFANYREQDQSGYDVYANLMKAVDVFETVLGFDHPETADIYSQMALAYMEQGNSAAASPWIRRAFTVFFKTFGPHDPVTQSAYETLKAIETNIDSKLDQVPYEELPLVIFEIEKQQKLMADQQQQLAALNTAGRYLVR